MMRLSTLRIAIPVALAASLAVASLTYGRGSFPGTWSNTYPGSMSDDNAAAAGSVCTLCHTQNGTSTWNPYGNAIKRKMDAGMNLAEALAAVESENSDHDPSSPPLLPNGWTNLMEINYNGQPGWTAGQNAYFDDTGYELGTMTAPAGMTSLDPSMTVDTVPATWGMLKNAFRE